MKSEFTPLQIALALALALVFAGPVLAEQQSEIDVWTTLLRPKYFPDQEIAEGKSVIELRVPLRAEDSGVVPISINAHVPQTPERFIDKLYIFIDRNPKPLAGVFDLTPQMGRADLAMRLRVEQFTNIRVVAQMNTGELHMHTGYTRASSGCSEPPPLLELKAARERIGQMKFRASSRDDGTSLGQLMISHPQVTGMQLDQRTRAFIPAEYVTKVAISFNGERILSAETDISISEDPSFRFFFKPDKKGVVTAEMSDSKGRSFTRTFEVEAGDPS